MEYVTLNNGIKMPKLGFGVFQITDLKECERVVKDAIEVGYRLIDTAQSYGNEKAVGNAVKNSGIPRSEFFITTKVWISNAGEDKARESIINSLEKMQMDYFDLVLIHQPLNDYYGTYRAMEKLQEEGKIKAIGVSNFYPDRLVDLIKFNKVVPAVNQIETHVFHQQTLAHEVMEKYGVQHEAWGPFAEGNNNLYNNETLIEIGKKYNKSSAQVALRYLLQMNVVVIPKSSHKERMEQNMDIFDFKLTEEDMNTILKLDEKTSLFFDHQTAEAVERLSSLVR